MSTVTRYVCRDANSTRHKPVIIRPRAAERQKGEPGQKEHNITEMLIAGHCAVDRFEAPGVGGLRRFDELPLKFQFANCHDATAVLATSSGNDALSGWRR